VVEIFLERENVFATSSKILPCDEMWQLCEPFNAFALYDKGPDLLCTSKKIVLATVKGECHDIGK